MTNKIKMKTATIAYMEKPDSWALPLAIFDNEELYAICAPVIEQWLTEHNSHYILTESCGSAVTAEATL